MKNIQVIDSSEDCPYNIYAVDDAVFEEIFAPATNVAFLEDVKESIGLARARRVVAAIERGLCDRRSITGIHGLLFVGLTDRRKFFPTMRYDEVGNGT